MVRAGNSNELVELFIDQRLIAIGWPEVGDLSDATTRTEIKARYSDTYLKRKAGRVNTDAAQLYAFINRMSEGDRALTYDKDACEYMLALSTDRNLRRDRGPHSLSPHPPRGLTCEDDRG